MSLLLFKQSESVRLLLYSWGKMEKCRGWGGGSGGGGKDVLSKSSCEGPNSRRDHLG